MRQLSSLGIRFIVNSTDDPVSLSVVLFFLRPDFSCIHFFEKRRNMSCDESHEPNKPEQSRTLFG